MNRREKIFSSGAKLMIVGVSVFLAGLTGSLASHIPELEFFVGAGAAMGIWGFILMMYAFCIVETKAKRR